MSPERLQHFNVLRVTKNDLQANESALGYKIVDLFRYTFGLEWNEWVRCESCDAQWGIKDAFEAKTHTCLSKAKIVDFHPRDEVLARMTRESTRGEAPFILVAMDDMENISGFMWGYQTSIDNLGIVNKNFTGRIDNDYKNKLKEVLNKKELSTDKFAYVSEVVINPTYKSADAGLTMSSLFLEEINRQMEKGSEAFVGWTAIGSDMHKILVSPSVAEEVIRFNDGRVLLAGSLKGLKRLSKIIFGMAGGVLNK